jgi:hypothetical protein
MSKRVSGSVLLLTTLAFSLVLGDVLVRAQDPQTQPATPQTQPTPTTKTKTSKRKRGQMKMNTPANETTTGDQTTPATPGDTTAPMQMPAQSARSMESTQTDLSGTYAGTFNCDALGLTGDTTLTINGNQFTTADGKTGRIVASTTHGYTAVALQTGDMTTTATTTPAAATTPGAAAATPPQIVSLRARKSGSRLTLSSVPGATMQCSFAPSRNVARRSRQTPSAAGTTVASPAEAGPTPADVTAPAKPARTRRGSTRRTTTPTTMPNPTDTPAQPTQPTPETPTPSQTPSPNPVPSPTPNPAPTPTPNPEPTQTPSPEPNPVPSPSPGGSPTPVPNPSPSPTTTPSPTPSPSPRPRG